MRYSAVDLFEARPAGGQAPLALKSAHRLLAPLPARLRLIPGDPHAGLARMANSLTNTDLVVIDADVDAQSLSQAWFYVPRMLHSRSVVLRQSAAGERQGGDYSPLSHDEVQRLADSSRPRRRRAA